MFHDMETEVAPTAPVQSVKRALDVLDLLAEVSLHGQAASLQQVADHLGVPVTTAHNLLKTLMVCQYAVREPTGGYGLGVRCGDLTRAARLGANLGETAGAVVRQLAEATGESVVLVSLLRGHRRPLLRVEGSAVVRVDAAFDEREPFFEMVTGRVLAAYASPRELAEVVRVHGLPGDGWAGIDTPELLETALAEVRAVGSAEDRPSGGEVTSMAAPVVDSGGALIGALGLYQPSFRADEERVRRLREELQVAARRLADALE